MANKARVIRESANVNDFDAELIRPELMDSLGLVWLVQVDGMVVDARHPPAPDAERGVRKRTHPAHPERRLTARLKATSHLPGSALARAPRGLRPTAHARWRAPAAGCPDHTGVLR